MPIM